MDRDGTREGYDLALLASVREAVAVPIIASGGAGSAEHVVAAFDAGADAALLAGALHDGTLTVAGLKDGDGRRGAAGARGSRGRSDVTDELDLDALDFDKGGGLVTVVVVDAADGAVLMVAHADRAALEATRSTGELHLFSRTRGAWHKGATSGNVQRVVALVADCDRDAVLAVVSPAGPACHTGARQCFDDPPRCPASSAGSTREWRAARRACRGRGATWRGCSPTRTSA